MDDGVVSLLLCSTLVVVCSVIATLLVILQEGKPTSGIVYSDDLWKPSCPSLHPFFLLAFRFLAFAYCTAILATDAFSYGPSVFYFYTQWSFLLLIIYFGLATVVSAKAISRNRASTNLFGSSEAFLKDFYTYGGNDIESKNAIATLQMYWETVFSESEEQASFFGFLMQIVYQTLGGAALLTDSVYWMGIFPLLREIPRSYDFLEINLHGMNTVFLLTDMLMNRMEFPWFRGAYFSLYTVTYVLFQWTVHALGVQWWPYPFLDPTQTYAPLWYLILAIGHVMCYGVTYGISSIKHRIFHCLSS